VVSLNKSARIGLRWLLLTPIPIAWCLLAHFGYLGVLENRMLDWRFRYRGTIQAPVKVCYVDVDSRSLSEIGGWPWSRLYFARVAKALIEQGGAKAVGMDFVFSTTGMSESIDFRKHVEGNIEFGRFLHGDPPVVLAAAYAGKEYLDINNKLLTRTLPIIRTEKRPLSEIEPPEVPEFEISFDARHPILWTPPDVGLIDTIDNGTRFVPAYAPTASRTYPHMAIELARLYWGLPRDAVKFGADEVTYLNADGTPKAKVPLINGQFIEINWFSPWLSPTNPRLSFSVVYAYTQNLESENPEARKSAQAFFAQREFKDCVVLIGPVDPLLQDLAPTAMDDSPVPKVGVHGNLLKTIISGRFLRPVPEAGRWTIVVLLSAIIAGLAVVGGGRGVPAKIAALTTAVGYAVLAFQLFKTNGLILPIAAPLGAAFTTSFVAIAWQVAEEQKQKGRIKGMFGAYVAPALVERMVAGEEPTLGGIEENITAYFSDIQSFSSFAEKLSPPRLVELMNEYLTACTDIIQAEGGTLDKYIGDAVVAIYGAPLALPDHPHRACVAALRVHRRSRELRKKWAQEGDRWPEIVGMLQTRIGLNTGPAVVGNMGSHTRFNYTMMGDNVNIAARMESGAKSWGVYSMCTDSTRTESERIEAGRVVFRSLGKIIVKGRSQPLPVHELVCLKEDATESERDCIAHFEEGLKRYYERDWDGALALFRKSELLEPNGPGRAPGTYSNPSLVYIGIAEGHRLNPPPADWTGIFEMKEK
jgi:adenylate cyclase